MNPLQFGKHKASVPTTNRSTSKDIAIVGVHGVFPDADNPKDFWDNIHNKIDLIKEIPADHFDYKPWYNPEKGVEDMLYTKWGSFINNVSQFDAEFFNISPIEAEMMDPQLRYLLQVLYHTIEDAGVINSIKGTNTGLYVGACFHDYGQEMDRLGLKVNPHDGTGNAATMLANRPSFYFDLKGPSMVIDTACSSSLIAIHTACRAIRNNECDQALVAGANLLLSSVHYRYFSSIGALSATGRCHSFDSQADGYIPGESVAAIMLKPLAQAEKDGDFIHGVIKGSATNHGGYTPSITAPSVDGEVDVLLKAWEDAEISPDSIGYIEAHGTGTKLGDPIEVNALIKAFKKHTSKTDFCAIGSAKAHMGHAEGAAGIIGVIKALFSIKNKTLPAMPKFEKLNPYIKLDNSPFFINKEAMNWKNENGAPLRGGVSSFGFGGAYAHLVLEEYIQKPKKEYQGDEPALIILSAKNIKALRRIAQNLMEYVRLNPECNIIDIAYTLHIAREQMDERFAIKVSNVEELIEGLTKFLKNKEEKVSDLLVDSRLDDTEVTSLIQAGSFKILLDKWQAGAYVNWEVIYGVDKPNKLSLPNYPFSSDHFWMPSPEKKSPNPYNFRQLHPLLHSNASTLKTTKFTSNYSGQESFLVDHIVKNMKIFPAVAYLELIRAAGEVYLEERITVIRNITWMNPLFVESSNNNNNKEIQLSILPFNTEFNAEVRSQNKEADFVHCEATFGTKAYSKIENRFAIDDFIKQAERIINGQELYADFSQAELNLGVTFQRVDTIYVKGGKALARIKNNKNDSYVYNPGTLDSALHTIYGLAVAPEQNYSLAFPYHINEVIFHAEIPSDKELWAIASEADTAVGNLATYNVDLITNDGDVLIQFKEFTAIPFKNEDSEEMKSGHTYLPVWKRMLSENVSTKQQENVLVLTGAGYENSPLLIPLLEEFQALDVQYEVEGEFTKLSEHITLIYFINGLNINHENDKHTKSESLFDTLKKLIQLGKNRQLNLCFFTQNTQAIFANEEVNSIRSEIVGWIGSLVKENTNWKTRIIDLGKTDWNESFIKQQQNIPFESTGVLYAYRNGFFYKTLLCPIDLNLGQSKLKQNGVYVILGGAGGIGEVTTKHLVEKYQAQVIWLGRSEFNEEIEQKLITIAKCGPRPLYLQCDALQLGQMESSRARINAVYGAVDGLFHSAIVLNDMRFEDMNHADFDQAYLPKSLASQNFVHVFKEDQLDFVCFYSSIQSQWNAAGQSNYSAGCTFKDSFAREVESKLHIPAYTINWGYWGEVGIVSGGDFFDRMHQLGIESISNQEGMAILESILSNNERQIIAINLNDKAKSKVENLQENQRYQTLERSGSAEVEVREPDSFNRIVEAEESFQNCCKNGLLLSLSKMGFVDQLKANNSLPKLQNTLGIQNKYTRLFEELVRKLVAANHLTLVDKWYELSEQGKNIISTYDMTESIETFISKFENYTAHVKLLQRCLNDFPAILKGDLQATETIFPEGSMEHVSGIYKGNDQADYFNECMASTVAQIVEHSIKAFTKGEKLRILEVGAGTGGTSELVFNKLLPHQNHLVYTYTDLSKSFLMYGESNYKDVAPYLETQLFNIEKSPKDQGIALGSYDIVIGANVVHATKNINNTIANIKQVLKPNGILLLNELATSELFTTLTFGLLDGWWLYSDPEIRLEGSPGLARGQWQRVLKEEGFTGIETYPKSQELSQQIIVARSNGTIKSASTITSHKTEETIEKVEANENVTVDEKWLIDELITIAAGTIKYKKETFDIHKQFMDYGFDSILGATLIKNINKKLEITLSPTEIFNYPNISELAQYIRSNYASEINQNAQIHASSNVKKERKETKPSIVTELKNQDNNAKNDIAVIGISGQFGSANDLSEFWNALSNGKSLIEEVPSERWDKNEYFHVDKNEKNKTYSKWGSFLNDIDKFDPLFFGISGGEAEMMDPQQRLFLQHAWKAIEDSGINPKTLSSKKCGVYVGASNGDYLTTTDNKPPSAFWGNSCAILPARISYLLNLKGPAIPIDTACSSSLVALDIGCKSLINGDTDLVITGGVTIMNSPNFYKLSSRAGMLSPDGTTYAFDKRANGFVPGEGVGVLVLKRLKDAERDGDVIHGVIKGSITNQDGTSNGILAPSVLSQEILEKEAYEKFNIDPKTISYVEAHGTGTALGDPIEFEALTKSFNAFSCPPQNCAIGSVKTNIGHTLMAAGVAGIIKVLLSFKNEQIPPSLNFETANPLIDFENSPFKIQRNLERWEASKTSNRRAAVSSFGFSGTNAHVILEEYKTANDSIGQKERPTLILLSAKTKNSIKYQAENLKSYIDSAPSVHVQDIAYTLKVGRESMNQKLAFIVQSKRELSQLLSDFLRNENEEKYYVGNTMSQSPRRLSEIEKEAVGNAIQTENLKALVDFWMKGVTIDWKYLYLHKNVKKLSLPTYPFEKKRYWKPEEVISKEKPNDNFKEERDIEKEVTLFQQKWKKGTLKAKQSLNGTTLIISDGSSIQLIHELQKRLRPSIVITNWEDSFDMDNISGCIDLSPLERQKPASFDWLLMLQQAIKNKRIQTLTLLVVTEDGQFNLDFADRIGLYQMLQVEYAKINSLHVEFKRTDALNDANTIMEAYLSDSDYTKLKFKSDGWCFPSMEKVDLRIGNNDLNNQSPVIITGGLGELGMICAKHLAVKHGFRKFILLSKKTLPSKLQWQNLKDKDSEFSSKINKIIALENIGAEVKLIAMETLDIGGLEAKIKSIQSQWGAIKGILHCAGVVDTDTPAFIKKDIKGIQRVFEPKVNGIKQLDRILNDNELDFAVLFSSISTFPVLGVGQSDYVMANHYLNAFAKQQRQNEKPYVSVLWPNWNQVGIEKISGGLYDQLGLDSISIEQGLDILDRVLSNNHTPAVIAPISFDKTKFDLNQLFEIRKKQKTTSKHVVGLQSSNSDWLKKLVARELKLPAEDLDINLPIQEFGVDSVILVQLIKELEKELFGISIDPTAILENPTIAMLSNYLEENFSNEIIQINSTNGIVKVNPIIPVLSEIETIEEEVVENHVKIPANVPIAVVGMACHFPEAENIKEFWENLRAGKDAIKEVPISRWDSSQFYSPEKGATGKSISKWGGFLKDIENFDPAYFGIKEDLASQIDPLQRQWLEVCAETIEDAGYNKEALSGKKVGVYAGSRLSTFRNKITEPCSDFIVGTGQNFITAHLSHIYNLKGPNLVVDTACSSSLTAIDLAVKDLRLGDTEMALAGGVDIILDEEIFVSLSRLSILSPSGRSKTFDQTADGTGLGEGCGVLMLKRLSDAIASNDKIYGVIEGTAVNNDGRTMGVTTPNPAAQEELLEKGIAAAGIKTDSIGYIESHGTGTLIGDPIELKGVTRVLRKCTSENAVCGIGSVKSNIGHLLSAAGIAGVIKTILAIRASEIPPTLHCTEPNRRFDFENAPVYPVQKLQTWDGIDGIRRAGVSAFGLGGNNAFVVISNQGIPKENEVEWPLKIAKVHFNKKRYWPEEEKKSEPQQSYEEKVFAQSLTFKI